MIGNFKYENNFPNKILLTDTQVSEIRKALPKIQSGGLNILDLKNPAEVV